jgi:RND family efflux transporter MFP subunit
VKHPIASKHFSVSAALLLSAASFSGCYEQPEVTPPVRTVTVAHPIKKDVVVYSEFTGTVRATETVDLRARVKGYLEKIDFKPSTFVKEGALLFVIEQAPYQAQLAEAEAAYDSAKAQLLLAQANLDRATKLVESKAVTIEEFQERRAKRDSAQAAVAATKASVEQAKINLGYTEVRAPVSGLIGRNLVDAGNLVGVDGDTLLATIVKIQPIYAYFDLTERDFNEFLRRRNKAADREVRGRETIELGLPGEDGFPHQGHFDYLDNNIDPETGTVQIRGVFPNKEELLFPGAFARIRVPSERKTGAILVAERAIGTDVRGKYVMLVNDKDMVEQRYVELGALVDGMRVVKKGLTVEDRYVINGIQSAIPGRQVKVETSVPVEAKELAKDEAVIATEAVNVDENAAAPATDD